MRTLIWVIFGVLAALWTGGAWLLAAAAQWLATAAASSQGADLGALVSRIPIPPWLSYWVDPAWLRLMAESLAWGLNTLGDMGPWFAGAVGWLSPLVWVCWALGFLLMLALAGGLHLLVGPSKPRAPPAPPPRVQGA